jgi:hypothetical protein
MRKLPEADCPNCRTPIDVAQIKIVALAVPLEIL